MRKTIPLFPVEPAEEVAAVSAEIRRQIDAGVIQGAVVAATGLPCPAAFGKQCIHPEERRMTVESRFDLASVGKVFTAGCCALLAAEGKLDPDAPFVRYLPEYRDRNCDITVRDLAMHVGGFDNSKPYESPDAAVFRRELFSKLPVRPRLAAFEYACSNYILLGMIAERISGTRLETLATERIWKPLGMKHTRWSAPGAGPDEVEHWFPNRPAGEHNDTTCHYSPAPLGNGSCFSTADDMMRFALDLLEQKRFPSVYYELATSCGFDKNGDRRSFGWDMRAIHRPRTLSERTIYHTGWTGQTICVDPGTGFAGVVLTSRTGDHEEAIAGRVRILEALSAGLNGNTSPKRKG